MEILDCLRLPPQLVSLLPCFPEFDPICVPPPANPPPHLWGRFMSMCLHHPPPRCLLVQAEHSNVYSSRRVLRPWVSVALSLSSFLLPSSLGLTLMWKSLGTSTRIYCLHCFLCMTLYAVSMLKKKRNEEKTFSKTNLHILDKKNNNNRGCILSVRLGNMLLPLCAFGLCVAVFCQHEILSPLEDFRGERAISPGIWRRQ